MSARISAGGKTLQLAHALGVAYAGVRRRAVMKDVMVSNLKPRARGKAEHMEAAAGRVLADDSGDTNFG